MGGLKEGRDGAGEDALPASKEGPEGREGADLGWVNEGLGWLKEGLGLLKEGLGWLELPENDLCWKPDMRSAVRLSDLSRPSARPPTMGEINVATVTTATAARDRIILFFHILLLLSSGVRPR